MRKKPIAFPIRRKIPLTWSRNWYCPLPKRPEPLFIRDMVSCRRMRILPAVAKKREWFLSDRVRILFPKWESRRRPVRLCGKQDYPLCPEPKHPYRALMKWRRSLMKLAIPLCWKHLREVEEKVCVWYVRKKRWKQLSVCRNLKQGRPLAMMRFILKNILRIRIISKFRSWETSMGMSFICMNVNVPFSVVTKRW